MAARKIIKIDESKCNGCGLCIPNCPEGALKIIDGKVRLISDLFCDGLGACIGHCPEGAIEVVEREAEAYDESKVMANIMKQGKNTVIEHLNHLQHHNEAEFLKQAVEVLKKHNFDIDLKEYEAKKSGVAHHQGCPGSRMMEFDKAGEKTSDTSGSRPSQLKQWPVQLHLVPPTAPYYKNRDVVLAADCTAYAVGDFHENFMKDKAIAIACPKLDSNAEVYINKIASMIDDAQIKSLTVLMMEVPCCFGLMRIAEEAASKAKRKIDIKQVIVGINGEVMK